MGYSVITYVYRLLFCGVSVICIALLCLMNVTSDFSLCDVFLSLWLITLFIYIYYASKLSSFWITCPSRRFRLHRLNGSKSYVVLRLLWTHRSLSSPQRWLFFCIVWSLTGPLYRIRQFVHASWMSLPAMRPGFCQYYVSFADRSEVFFLGFGANWTCNQGRPNVRHDFKNSICVVSSHHFSSLVLQ